MNKSIMGKFHDVVESSKITLGGRGYRDDGLVIGATELRSEVVRRLMVWSLLLRNTNWRGLYRNPIMTGHLVA
jgi:hypothetical protein